MEKKLIITVGREILTSLKVLPSGKRSYLLVIRILAISNSSSFV